MSGHRRAGAGWRLVLPVPHKSRRRKFPKRSFRSFCARDSRLVSPTGASPPRSAFRGASRGSPPRTRHSLPHQEWDLLLMVLCQVPKGRVSLPSPISHNEPTRLLPALGPHPGSVPSSHSWGHLCIWECLQHPGRWVARRASALGAWVASAPLLPGAFLPLSEARFSPLLSGRQGDAAGSVLGQGPARDEYSEDASPCPDRAT